MKTITFQRSRLHYFLSTSFNKISFRNKIFPRISLIALILPLLFLTSQLAVGQDLNAAKKEQLIGKSMAELSQLGYIDSSNLELRSNTSGQQTTTNLIDCTAAFIPVDGTYTSISRNDDGFTGPISIPFNFSFCATDYTSVWVNTNGNITFTGGLGVFNASGFPYNVPMVAPFWADVDTRNCSGLIYYKVMPDHMIVTWQDVTYYPANNCPVTNSFQVIISDATAPIIGAGQNIQFRYADMSWTTGTASGGGPFGGIPATVGWNSGNNTNFEQIGRFNQDSAVYDGPFGADDGVHFLDNNCFSFASQGVGPSITCSDITRSLDANGTVSIIASEVAIAQDGCSGATITLSKDTFTCADVGTNLVTATATNGVGQTASCTLTVTIVDDTPPTITCQGNVTLNNDPGVCGATYTYTTSFSDNCASATLTQTSGLPSGSVFPLGTTINTFVTTDASGNSTSCGFEVTVNDTEIPVIMCPADITVPNDSEICGAIVNFDLPTVSDNCSGSIIGNVLENGSFETGDYSSWNIVSGSTACGIWGIMSDGQTLNSGDPIYNHASNTNQSVIFPQGLPITFSPTDGDKMAAFFQNCGPFAHKLYQDVMMPVGSSQLCYDLEYNNFSSSFGTNQYFAVEIRDSGTDALLETLFITNPGDALNIPMTHYCFDTSAYSGMAIRVQMIKAQIDLNPITIFIDNIVLGSDLELVQTAGLESGSEFPVGTTTNTFVVTDGSGNSETCSFDITVEDTEPPVVVCQDVVVDLDANGNASITTDDIDNGSTDNCEIDTIELSQYDFDCSNVGDVTVTLTVTDIHGNSSECIATVTVNGIIPTVTIAQSELPEFCQGAFILLTATSDDAIAYEWTDGTSTPVLEVSANGTYGVTVTSATNCTAYAEFEVVGYDPEILLSSYIMIAEKEVHLHNDTYVLSGAIGVTDDKGKAKIHDNSHVTDFVKADKVDVKQNSSVGAAINSPAVVTLPPFIFNTLSDNNSPDVTVNNNQSVTLSGSVYDKIEIKDGGSVLFTSPDIYIKELKTKKDASIEFAGCTNLYIQKHLKFEKNNTFNSDGNFVVAYVDGKIDVKEGSIVTAHLYSYDKDIDVKGKDNDPTFMKGLFIGEKIKGDKNVIWELDSFCDSCANPLIMRGDTSIVEDGLKSELSSLILYPNPGRSYVMLGNPLNIELQSITIYDLTGRQLNSVNLAEMSTEMMIDISQLSSATYVVIIEGVQGKIVKQLIKE